MDQAAPGSSRTGSPANADTIFAVASGAARAAIAVLRISGPGSGGMVDALCGARPEPRYAALRSIRSKQGEVLDRGLVLWFPGPGSYTGEDSAELHLHGSRAVLSAVAGALTELGARPARAGEFTRRAFMNGRMDLLEAEAVADLVEAESETQRKQALRQLDGDLGALFREWSHRVRDALALQEALIDFSDDEVPSSSRDELSASVEELLKAMSAHLADSRRGERVRAGLTIAVAGAPNVGKSSLVNVLCGHDVAIVAALPGTTRDPIDARMELAGVVVTLVDTAGLRESGDPVEVEGMRRARSLIEDADLVIEVVDASRPMPAGIDGALLVANKVDLAPAPGGAVGVSAMSGEGIAELRRILVDRVGEITAQSGPPPLTRERHRAHLQEAAAQLRASLEDAWPELKAEHLRFALASLGEITGEVGVEAVLDAIFGRFCIGK